MTDKSFKDIQGIDTSDNQLTSLSKQLDKAESITGKLKEAIKAKGGRVIEMNVEDTPSITFGGIPGLDTSHNQLTGLNEVPQPFSGSFDTSKNQLTSLEDELAKAARNRDNLKKQVESQGGEVIEFKEDSRMIFGGIPGLSKSDIQSYIESSEEVVALTLLTGKSVTEVEEMMALKKATLSNIQNLREVETPTSPNENKPK